MATRETKYCNGIRGIVEKLNHVTNADILAELQKSFPKVSATTVHRATARLAARGELAMAPPDKNGAMRYDVNLKQHDHFMCLHCGRLRDINVVGKVISVVKMSLPECRILGRVLISGTCETCLLGEHRQQ